MSERAKAIEEAIKQAAKDCAAVCYDMVRQGGYSKDTMEAWCLPHIEHAFDSLPADPVRGSLTEGQCFQRNASQHRSDRHPYTCGNDSRHRPLIATRNGWKCADCEYTQDWSPAEPTHFGTVPADAYMEAQGEIGELQRERAALRAENERLKNISAVPINASPWVCGSAPNPDCERCQLIAQLTAATERAESAERKCANSLARNLCPDHRDKQAGKPCLACHVEQLERQLQEAGAAWHKFRKQHLDWEVWWESSYVLDKLPEPEQPCD